ncbi:Golgi-specific brefeldin A-resistance guanine nucleotide exchange factor 1-like [Artemia franciscana]|uniref:Golgi-specific brefeldin A-resistance guanine nucleotide exchange factor 1-like n=1 Tax=Artemia franciscana TaxID=6661 RepID=UPI0032DB9D22
MKPDNSVFIVQGEIYVLLGALRPTNKWTSNPSQEYEHNPFVIALKSLRDRLIKAPETLDQDISQALGPFLDVVKAENISGPVTELALTSIGKFIKLRLIDPSRPKCAEAVRSIAFSLSHAKFSGTDSSNDEVVLMKILEVLRDIFLSPCGILLSNDNICEIVQSCFKLCFEERVTDLLRRGAESILENLVQFLFERLPTYPQESKRTVHDVKIRSQVLEASFEGSKLQAQEEENEKITDHVCMDNSEVSDKQEEACEDHELSTPTAQSTLIADQASIALSESNNSDRLNAGMIFLDSQESSGSQTDPAANVTVVSTGASSHGLTSSIEIETPAEFVNPKGIRFTHDIDGVTENEGIVPYGIPFVVEILRYLVTLVDPHDSNSSDRKITIGLRLITVAVEAGVDFFGISPPLMNIVKDNLCKNLISLLIKERNSIFIGSVRICFLLFEALRSELKLQLQMYLSTLRSIIMASNPKVTAERRELALEGLVQIWKLPGIVTEMYLNYDCDVNCSNLLEDTVDTLQKVASPDPEITPMNILAFNAMMFVIDEIESRCRQRIATPPQSLPENVAEVSQTTPGPESSQPFRLLRVRVSSDLPTHEQLLAAKHKKLILMSGAEKFNEKPTKGIQFLQEEGLLSTPLDSTEVAMFLRNNSRLDKKMIGEYLSNRKNLEILDAFVKSFDFSNKRIDLALRAYLESFRLPGEAPLIDNLIQAFADHWHKSTGEPFANSGAAFTLAYAVIMLNTDQHNTNAKKQNVPMTETDFIRNLRGVNSGENFDQEMLTSIYNAIRSEEIVMPAEQSGIVRENYLWKVLLGRSATSEGNYLHASNGMLDHELFQILAKGPIVQTLCMLWDPLIDPKALQRILHGFKKCVMIGFHYNMTDTVDSYLNTLSKFVPLISNYDHQYVAGIFGRDNKGQLALRTYFLLIRRYCNTIRDAWKNLCTCLLGLYNANLLPNKLLEIDDIIEGTVSIEIKSRETRRSDTGFIYSLFNIISSSDYQLSPEELDAARSCVQECGIEELLNESKFMRAEALIEFVKAIVEISPLPEGSEVTEYSKSVTVFFMGLLSKIIIQNGERASLILPVAKDHLLSLILDASANNEYYLLDRSVNVLLRLAICLISKEELTSAVLHSLGVLLQIKATSLERVSKPIIWGLYELLKAGSSFVKEDGDWVVLFTLLECAGAGASLPKIIKPTGSFQDQNEERRNHETGQESDKGYTSDSELYSLEQKKPSLHHGTSTPDLSTSSKCQTGGWMVVGKEGEIESLRIPLHYVNQYSLEVARELFHCEPSTYKKSIDVLEWIIRESGCVNYVNYRYLVQCCRVFGGSLYCKIHNKEEKGNEKTSSRKVAQ